jgi:LuxR family transcriptional regulator, activator of tox operons
LTETDGKTEDHAMSTSVGDPILALGEPAFDAQFIAYIERECAADWCSAFVIQGADRCSHLFSHGNTTRRSVRASDASHEYATRYWLRDTVTHSVLALPGRESGAQMRRRRSASIEDQEYRALHVHHQVVDRVSLYRFFPEDTGIVLNLYRSHQRGEFSADALTVIENNADFASALVAKHRALLTVGHPLARHPPIDAMAVRLRESAARLSHREAEVCALYLTGSSDKEAARITGLEVTSIATYRRRAYQKIGVTGRQGLARYYDACASEVCAGAPLGHS